jgi:two-component system sensor histidine kinase YesM
MIAVVVLCTLIPLIIIGLVSYYYLHIQWDRIRSGIQQNVANVRIGLEKTLSNLDYASMQLAYNGRVGDKVVTYLETQDIATKYEYKKEINDYISLISFTNPDLGTMFYYFPGTEQPMFQNYQIKEGFRLSSLPVLAQQKGVTFYGPHTTAYKQNENSVFAISRKLDTYREDCFVYIELNFSLFEKQLNRKQYGLDAAHMLLDDRGRIVYCGDNVKGAFPLGTTLPSSKTENGVETAKGYYLFHETSDQGWQVVEAIDRQAYNRVVYDWIARFILLAGIALAVSLLLALAVWRIVYKPLTQINVEMGLISQSNFSSEIRLTGIREFDSLLKHFRHMRDTIIGLFGQIEQKEQMKARVEVEKLLYQINPHFLYNTLNTVQWFARTNQQKKIDRFIALLTGVLQYNLGKEGGTVKLSDEIKALRNYVELQRMKLESRLEMRICADSQALAASVPRFILQPLVENAIYHGIRGEDGEINVYARCEGELLLVSIQDSGKGFAAEDMMPAEEDAGGKIGMGIGLNYVRRMLEVHYGGKAGLSVDRAAGGGAVFTLRLPAASAREGGARGDAND